jgi:hypothetical protein
MIYMTYMHPYMHGYNSNLTTILKTAYLGHMLGLGRLILSPLGLCIDCELCTYNQIEVEAFLSSHESVDGDRTPTFHVEIVSQDSHC